MQMPEGVTGTTGFELLEGSEPDGVLLVGDAGAVLPVLARENSEVLGSVKLCYIDPPYNTGENFAYYSDRRGSEQWLAVLRSHLEALVPLLSSDA
ncbi:hypothetical protein, partial [Streptomyces asiaticus]|uniref:hypothetical protein n=1 Tax=Streptomyces asiaticus TaxID=114695 RepID=UPI003CD0B284